MLVSGEELSCGIFRKMSTSLLMIVQVCLLLRYLAPSLRQFHFYNIPNIVLRSQQSSTCENGPPKSCKSINIQSAGRLK